MISHLDSHTTTDVKPDQMSKPEMEFHMIRKMYVALPMCLQQKRRRFHAKTTRANLNIYIGVGALDLCIDKAHMALDVFRFGVFFIPPPKKKTCP